MKGFLYALLGISLVLNVLSIGFIFYSDDGNSADINIRRNRNSYPFLSPRIFVENQNDLIINFVPLRKKLQEYASIVPNRLGIYFEYLPTGTSIGINEKEEFIPASLLKTPLAMGVLKQIESKKINPNDTLVLHEKHKNSNFGTLWQQKTGNEYKIIDILKQLIRYSDNTAQNILLELVPTERVEDVFDFLDIPKIKDAANNPVVTAKNYSSILRCLYLSCYLTYQNSNWLLDLLSTTFYNDKLPSGLPENIKISHKIGVVGDTKENSNNIYTDCGIIYYPKRPYILCVMIQSNNNTATEKIKNISKIVFNYIASHESNQ